MLYSKLESKQVREVRRNSSVRLVPSVGCINEPTRAFRSLLPNRLCVWRDVEYRIEICMGLSIRIDKIVGEEPM